MQPTRPHVRPTYAATLPPMPLDVPKVRAQSQAKQAPCSPPKPTRHSGLSLGQRAFDVAKSWLARVVAFGRAGWAWLVARVGGAKTPALSPAPTPNVPRSSLPQSVLGLDLGDPQPAVLPRITQPQAQDKALSPTWEVVPKLGQIETLGSERAHNPQRAAAGYCWLKQLHEGAQLPLDKAALANVYHFLVARYELHHQMFRSGTFSLGGPLAHRLTQALVAASTPSQPQGALGYSRRSTHLNPAAFARDAAFQAAFPLGSAGVSFPQATECLSGPYQTLLLIAIDDPQPPQGGTRRYLGQRLFIKPERHGVQTAAEFIAHAKSFGRSQARQMLRAGDDPYDRRERVNTVALEQTAQKVGFWPLPPSARNQMRTYGHLVLAPELYPQEPAAQAYLGANRPIAANCHEQAIAQRGPNIGNEVCFDLATEVMLAGSDPAYLLPSAD